MKKKIDSLSLIPEGASSDSYGLPPPPRSKQGGSISTSLPNFNLLKTNRVPVMFSPNVEDMEAGKSQPFREINETVYSDIPRSAPIPSSVFTNDSRAFVKKKVEDSTPTQQFQNTVNFTRSVMMCNDPMCTVCPPELHARRRNVTFSLSDSEKPKRTLEEDLKEFDEDEGEIISPTQDDKKEEIKQGCMCCGIGPCCTCLFKKSFKGKRHRKQFNYFTEFFQMLKDLFTSFGVLNPHSSLVKNWNKIFVCTCLIAFAIDPLYFFVLYIDKARLCFKVMWSYTAILTVFRTITDFCYLIHMVLQFRIAYVAKPPHKLWWGGMYHETDYKPGDVVFDPKHISKNYINGPFLIDLLAVLPLPQIIMYGIAPYTGSNVADRSKNILRISVLLQYIPRGIRFVPLLSGSYHSTGFVFETAWANFVLNLIMFVMASHVIGSVWYLFGIQRMIQCLEDVCVVESKRAQYPCKPSFLVCSNGATKESESWSNNTTATTICARGSDFQFGIYGNAIPLFTETNGFKKYVYGLFWGFQQVSTLAGNQTPSTYVGEVLFVFLITGLGLLLFSLLIGNIQNFLQSLSRRTFEYQIRRRDIEQWMKRRHLSNTLTKRVRELSRYQWTVNRGVDESEVLDTLTEDLQRDIRRHLYLELVKKCELFSVMDESVLDAICERLTQEVFISNTIIIKEGFPVKKMFFILRGELVSTTTNNGRTGFFNMVTISNGDFFGEELLVSFLESSEGGRSIGKMKRNASFGKLDSSYSVASRLGSLGVSRSKSIVSSAAEVLPLSERTVVCIGPVQAFSLSAADIEFVCKQFRRNMLSPEVQKALNRSSHNRRTRAAMTIQLAWRAFVRKKLGLTIPQLLQAAKQRRIGLLIKDAHAHAQRISQQF